MMSQNNVPEWLSWVVPVITALGVVWAAARRLLVSVTREELADILKEAEESREKRRLELHQENLRNFGDLFERIGEVEKDVSHIRGELSARKYP